MKVAIVCDWLDTYSGAERVLEHMLRLFPDASLYALVDFVQERNFLQGKLVHTSFLQRLPFARRAFRAFLPLMPLAIENLNCAGHDLILSSSHAVAKGVRVQSGQLHLCYCHTPMRYAWTFEAQYLSQIGRAWNPAVWAARLLLRRLRRWDVYSADRVHQFAANSHYVAARIAAAYKRKARVIYPPVEIERFQLGEWPRRGAYVTAARLVPYKRVDLLVAAFARMPARQLVVIGRGPELSVLRAQAPPNVKFLGRQPDEVLHQYLRQARAFLFAAEEDFGILPVEAQASGTPVIAYEKGGVLESVCGLDNQKPTGLFFPEQSVPAVIHAIEAFERVETRFSPQACRSNAERFSAKRFQSELSGFIADAQRNFNRGDILHMSHNANSSIGGTHGN